MVYKSMENSPASDKLLTTVPKEKHQHGVWTCPKKKKRHVQNWKEDTRNVECFFGGTKGGGLTFNVTPDIGFWPLVFVNQLNDAQKILLLELLERLGNLFVVILLSSLLAHEAFLLGSVLVGRQRARLAKPLLECLGRVLEDDGVRHLILVLLEVEVVDDGSQLGLFRGVEVDANLKLTPTFVRADEGGFGKGCSV